MGKFTQVILNGDGSLLGNKLFMQIRYLTYRTIAFKCYVLLLFGIRFGSLEKLTFGLKSIL